MMHQGGQMKSWRRPVILIGAPSLLVVLLALHAFWDPIGRWQLAAAVDALREAGEPVTLAELADLYPEPPAGRNAASLFQRAGRLKEANADVELENDLPIQGAAELPDPSRPFPAPILANIRKYLANQAERLRLLHKAAAMDGCHFGLEGSAYASRKRIQRVCHMRDAARLLALEAVERAASGKPDEALESLRAGLRLAHALRTDPWLIPVQVGIVCDGFVLSILGYVLSCAEPSPAALRRLEEALRRELDPALLATALIADRCVVIDNHTSELQGFRLAPNMNLEQYLGGVPSKFLRMIPVPSRVWVREKLYFIDTMNACVAAARKPYPQSLITGLAVARAYKPKLPNLNVLGGPNSPRALTLFFTLVQRLNAQLGSGRLALAALRYRAKHGKLPESLQALVPDFIDAVPPDPFTGKGLLYRKSDDGFVVYALGKNGHDDGGDLQWDRAKSHYRDIGFRVRWPKAGE
jgi:hypothetical protein